MRTIICELKSLPNKRTLIIVTLLMSMSISTLTYVIVDGINSTQTQHMHNEIGEIYQLIEEKTKDRYYAEEAVAFNKSVLEKLDTLKSGCNTH